MNWSEQGSCRDMGPEQLFFPVGDDAHTRLQTAAAKTVCSTCPVVVECRTWALDSAQETGVWGGTSESERRALKHRGALAHTPTSAGRR